MEKRTDALSERHSWMDLARILACFAVILIHSQGNTTADAIAVHLCHCAVPVFVMISGTNFLKKDREMSVTKMWKKYILPLAEVFFTWSFLYAIWTSYADTKALNFEFVKTVFINTINGHYHLWYIWMTIGIYMVLPFIKKFTDNSSKKELIYYLSLAFAYLSLVFMVEFYPFNSFASLA
ncbi:MAG: acyltransferase family protein, partial [Clostridia bacterium]|nr:acyltransferase family protein [Clostridia bacterium]